MTEEIIVDTPNETRSSMAGFAAAFAEVWQATRERLDQLLALLDENVVLKAPTTTPVMQGHGASRRVFERAFRAMPDWRAEAHRRSAENDALFIEMSFSAAIGGKLITWRNVDRFLFRGGGAVERIAFFNPVPVRGF